MFFSLLTSSVVHFTSYLLQLFTFEFASGFGKSFAKMCKDTKLIDKKLDGTNVDLIFAKSKAKTDRRITFD